jgi:YD repeat-containing protein
MKKVMVMTVFLLVIGSLYGQSEPKVNQVTLVYRHEGAGMGESSRIYDETCIKYRNDGWHDFEFTYFQYSNPSSKEWYANAITPLYKETPHVFPSYEVWTVNFEYENQTYILIRQLGNQEGTSTVLRR